MGGWAMADSLKGKLGGIGCVDELARGRTRGGVPLGSRQAGERSVGAAAKPPHPVAMIRWQRKPSTTKGAMTEGSVLARLTLGQQHNGAGGLARFEIAVGLRGVL